jgi:hypothetical protein
MFGENKLDNESVKYFAKQDFFLASNLPELEEQLRTILDFLILLTRNNSIAVEGYKFGLKFIDMNHQSFLLAIHQRQTFCVEFAYTTSIVYSKFQGFLYRLWSRHGKKNAISGSRRELDGFQRKSIAGTLIGFEFGLVPNLRCPIAFMEEEDTPGGDKRTAAPTKTATKTKQGTKPEWWSTNLGPESACAIPEGKSNSDIFNLRDPALKKNLLLWPELKHHSLGKKKPSVSSIKQWGSARPGALWHTKPLPTCCQAQRRQQEKYSQKSMPPSDNYQPHPTGIPRPVGRSPSPGGNGGGRDQGSPRKRLRSPSPAAGSPQQGGDKKRIVRFGATPSPEVAGKKAKPNRVRNASTTHETKSSQGSTVPIKLLIHKPLEKEGGAARQASPNLPSTPKLRRKGGSQGIEPNNS